MSVRRKLSFLMTGKVYVALLVFALAVVGGVKALKAIAQTNVSLSDDSVWIGTSRLTLGMTEEDVNRALRPNYTAKWISTARDRQALVCRLHDNNDCPVSLIASTGVVDSIDLDRGPQNTQEGVDLAQSAYYALEELSKSPKNIGCRVSRELSDSEHTASKTALITCGQRYVAIRISQVKGARSDAWVSTGLSAIKP
jgi:hypothetical protein